MLTTDIFSFTQNGSPWRTQSWLPELMYRWFEVTFEGLAWVNWMVLVAALTTVAFIGLSVYRTARSPLACGLVMMVSAWLVGPFIQPRPVIFSYVLLAVLVVVLQNKDRALWAVVVVIWLWSGVHGSWIIGGALVFLEWLRTWDRRLLYAGAAAGLATLATAHGIGTWQIVLDFFQSRDALALIQEWQPPNFADIVQGPYLLLVIGVLIAAVRSRIEMRDLLVIVPFLVFGMGARRAVVPAAIVLIPWAAAAIPDIRTSSAPLKRWVGVVALGVVGLVALMPMVIRPLGVIDKRFPSSDIVAAMGDGRAFHGDAEGGYLIYATWPDRLVFIDDRAELFGREGFEEYRDVRAGDYEAAFARWDIDTALSRVDWGLSDALVRDGWTVVAEDESFIVLRRP